MTAARRWSCSARRAGRIWEARADAIRQRIAALLVGVSDDDQVALWLAAQVVVRVLGQMRETAGLQGTAGAEAAG